jgi:hypothetical protein
LQLLEKKSDPKSKFDLFQRLNSGGMAANDQELRNCALVMVSKPFFDRIKNFAESDLFSKLIPLGPTSLRKANHHEHVCKIMAFSFREYTLGSDIEEFVTNAMIDIAEDAENHDRYFEELHETLLILDDACGVGALKPYKDGKFVGRIGRTSIEIILIGAVRCIDTIKSKPDPTAFVRTRIEEFGSTDEAKKFSAAGVTGTDRVQYTIPRGESLFSL